MHLFKKLGTTGAMFIFLVGILAFTVTGCTVEEDPQPRNARNGQNNTENELLELIGADEY